MPFPIPAVAYLVLLINTTQTANDSADCTRVMMGVYSLVREVKRKFSRDKIRDHEWIREVTCKQSDCLSAPFITMHASRDSPIIRRSIPTTATAPMMMDTIKLSVTSNITACVCVDFGLVLVAFDAFWFDLVSSLGRGARKRDLGQVYYSLVTRNVILVPASLGCAIPS